MLATAITRTLSSKWRKGIRSCCTARPSLRSATTRPLASQWSPCPRLENVPTVLNSSYTPSQDGKHHPRLITLGGDHTIVLPLLRSIYSAYGEISVIHFDR
jgi:hypothetical protein